MNFTNFNEFGDSLVDIVVDVVGASVVVAVITWNICKKISLI